MGWSGFSVERECDYLPEFKSKILDLTHHWLQNHQVYGQDREAAMGALIGAVEDVAIALREAHQRMGDQASGDDQGADPSTSVQ